MKNPETFSCHEDDVDEYEQTLPREIDLVTITKKYKDNLEVQREIAKWRKSNTLSFAENLDELGVYLREAGNYQLLSAEDEKRYFKAIDRGLEVYGSLESLEDVPKEDERILLETAAAHQVIFHTNLRLVVKFTKQYWEVGKPGMSEVDVISEGNFGLNRAISKFEEKKGFKFSTYAASWIKQYASRGVSDQSRLIAIPRRQHESFTAAKRRVKNEEALSGKVLTDDEIVKVTGMDITTYNDLARINQRYLFSLDQPIDENDKSSPALGAFVDNDKRMSFAEALAVDDAHRRSIQALFFYALLNDREKMLAGLRNELSPRTMGNLELTSRKGEVVTYGEAYKDVVFNGFTGKLPSYRDIGARFGLSLSRTSTLGREVMEKLMKTGEEHPELAPDD